MVNWEYYMFCGKPPGRPPDPKLVRDVSHYVSPLIDPREVGPLEGYETT